jgi:hypothetical protein
VRARCERTAVERSRALLGGTADFGSVLPILSVGVRWGRAIGWVCKSEAAGSNPARSIFGKPNLQHFLGSVSTTGNSGASAVRADPRMAVEPSRVRSSHGACLPESDDVEWRRRSYTPEVATPGSALLIKLRANRHPLLTGLGGDDRRSPRTVIHAQ